MRILIYCLLLHLVYAQYNFGTPYLKNPRLCQHWACINTKLGLPESLPPRDQYTDILKSLLPEGAWQDVVEKVLDKCYGHRTRIYSNACPGQALLHCVVEQLIEQCPEEHLRKDDTCAPISSVAGFNYMFTQSRYENLANNLPENRRPSWFLSHYFNSKCCNLPELFNSTVLSECGFSSIMHYYSHVQTNYDVISYSTFKANNHLGASNTIKPEESYDPLDCCDMNEFIRPDWRSECNFGLAWQGSERLKLRDQNSVSTTPSPVLSTSTKAPLPEILPPGVTSTDRPYAFDIKVVPLPCEKEICIFKKLNIITESGTVDKIAFTKLLDNFTDEKPAWSSAKARVVSKCLNKNGWFLKGYEGDCEINKVLACTLDVLSENCPNKSNRNDLCQDPDGMVCQISSSKYRPKHRRVFCDIPKFVRSEVLKQCDVETISTYEYVPQPTKLRPTLKKHTWSSHKYACEELTNNTKCLLNKMGILNKYSFLDYFKMKQAIRDFTADQHQPEWSSFTDVYLSSFTNAPLYSQHCSSARKLLNVIDTMLMTCPVSRRKNTHQCNNIFTEIANSAPFDRFHHLPRGRLSQMPGHFQHMIPLTNFYHHQNELPRPYKKSDVVHRPSSKNAHEKIRKTPLYDFGMFGSEGAPPVQVIDIKPHQTTFQRRPQYSTSGPDLTIASFHHDGVFRSG